MGIWLTGGFAVALVLAWLAAKLHASFAVPFGSVPIALGLLLGFVLGILAAKLRIGLHRGAVIGAVLLAVVAIVAQHAWLYVEFRRQWHEARARSPEVAMFRPEEPWPPGEYFRRELESGSALYWGIDAALIAASAVGLIWMMERKRREAGIAADANTAIYDTRNPTPDT